jgi:hypothetical protein
MSPPDMDALGRNYAPAKPSANGDECWWVYANGEPVMISAKKRTVNAMDEAVKKYARVLKRLADR